MQRKEKMPKIYMHCFHLKLSPETNREALSFSCHIPQPSELKSSFLNRNIRSFQVLACWPKETLQTDMLNWLSAVDCPLPLAFLMVQREILLESKSGKGNEREAYCFLLLFKESCWANKRSLEARQKPIPPYKWQKALKKVYLAKSLLRK